MTTAVIVQARSKSTRLPSKTLLPLGGATVLAEVLRRVAQIPGADVVCCAIPEGDDDEPVAREAAAAGAVVVRGPQDDVLARYHLAATEIGAEVVMRVTSDCPLIDPSVCGEVLAKRRDTDTDYACNNMPRGFPHGLDCEAFTAAALAQADRRATSPREREHVTPWLRETEGIRRAVIDGPGGPVAQYRWTLDYREDYLFLSALFDAMPRPAPTDWLTVASFLTESPALLDLNRHLA